MLFENHIRFSIKRTIRTIELNEFTTIRGLSLLLSKRYVSDPNLAVMCDFISQMGPFWRFSVMEYQCDIGVDNGNRDACWYAVYIRLNSS